MIVFPKPGLCLHVRPLLVLRFVSEGVSDNYVHAVFHSDVTYLRKPTWFYCPGHAGVQRNDRTGRLVGKATSISGLRRGQGQYSIDRLEDRNIERGNAQRPSWKGREVRPTLELCQRQRWETSERRGKAHMDFPERLDVVLNGTELNPPTRMTRRQQLTVARDA